MLATAQTAIDFTSLNDAAKQAVRQVFDGLEEASTIIDIPASPAAAFRQLPEQTIGVVEQGLLSVLFNNTIVSVLEPGDLLLPDVGGLSSGCDPLRYGSEQGAQVRLWSLADLNTTLQRDGVRQTAWLSALVLTQSLTTRLAAVNNGEMVGGSQESEQFSSGQVIIQQGDLANYVYYMLEGEADVLLNDRGIARVTTGEMFGTVAALTQSHRNATVRARTDCSVLQVPTEHFSELIRSHPAAVERLLVDMAKSITQLNEEVVALRHRQQSR